MKKLLVGIMMVVVFTSAVVAGPIERMFLKEGYTKAVHSILVGITSKHDDVNGEVIRYAQGLAIGPHHILTAGHIATVPKDGDYEIEKIAIVTHNTNEDFEYITLSAEVVAIGSWDVNKPFNSDWSILKTKERLCHWKVVELGKAEVGDTLYHLSGRAVRNVFIFPVTVVGDVLMQLTHSDNLTYGIAQKWKVYVTYPLIQSGDSGSPVFTKEGRLVGLMNGGNQKVGIITKSKSFKRQYNKYKGK